MDREEMKALLLRSMERLGMAARRLSEPVHPHVPLPRPRVFELATQVRWPYPVNWTDGWWVIAGRDRQFWLLDHRRDREHLADILLDGVGERPRAVLRLLRRLDVAVAWCDARRCGRERAAAEVLRQQAKAVDTLEAMAAVQAIGGGA